ncbi:hypothetical protein [Aggregatibacter kilianii]|uniref:hypothetical protein n=1 Tax=Aggregatibacter kilianii TaxID=2025884 RepID=UPI001EF8A337|nr:hypothetical protein [Aggregatibacter kilianii]
MNIKAKVRSFLETFFIKHKTLKFLTALILFAILLLHSYVGIVTIDGHFGDDYDFFIKKEFNSKVMFHAPLVMRDYGSEVSNEEFEQIVEFCEIVTSPQDWNCDETPFLLEKQKRELK